jgi:hypothetical protein
LLIAKILVVIGADHAACAMALQWTKRAHSATLHCNVDRGGIRRLLI